MAAAPNHSKINAPTGRFENENFVEAYQNGATAEQLFLIAKPVAALTSAYLMRKRGNRENGFNLHFDDCVQLGEIAIWNAIHDGKWEPSRGKPYSFFFRLSKNAALDHLRLPEIRHTQPVDPAALPYITGADGQVPTSAAEYTDLIATAHASKAASRDLSGDSILEVAARWVVDAVLETHMPPNDQHILEALEHGFHLDEQEARQAMDAATITLRAEFKGNAQVTPDVTAIRARFAGTPLAGLLRLVPAGLAATILSVCAGTSIEFPDREIIRASKRDREIALTVQAFRKGEISGSTVANRLKRHGVTMKQAREIHMRYVTAVRSERIRS